MEPNQTKPSNAILPHHSLLPQSMLTRKFGRWGFLRPVLLLWNKLEALCASPDEFAYNALIDALADKGMIELARKYDEEMLAKGCRPSRGLRVGKKSSRTQPSAVIWMKIYAALPEAELQCLEAPPETWKELCAGARQRPDLVNAWIHQKNLP